MKKILEYTLIVICSVTPSLHAMDTTEQQKKDFALIAEIEGGNPNIHRVRKLLKDGASAKIITKSGGPLLTQAIQLDKPDVVKALLEHGASESYYYDFIDPLSVAIKKRDPVVVQLLLDTYSSPVARDLVLDATPIAIAEKELDILEKELEDISSFYWSQKKKLHAASWQKVKQNIPLEEHSGSATYRQQEARISTSALRDLATERHKLMQSIQDMHSIIHLLEGAAYADEQEKDQSEKTTIERRHSL